MDTDSRQPRGRDSALSLLNVTIETLDLAKEVSSIPQAAAAFASVSILLTMIRDSKINELTYVELGLYCADICRALDRAMNGRKLDDLTQSVREAIKQLTTTVAEIQKMILKQSKRNSISRRFYAKNDKETIATWRSDLNSILLVFNTELVINTHMTVSDIHRNSLRARSLSTPPDKADTHVVGGHRSAVLFPNRSIELSAVAYGNRSNRRSTTSSTAKLVLREMRDSADAIGPLKSVAGSLCFILEICERTKANKQAMESLAPRVKALAESLRTPALKGDVGGQERRERLELKLEDIRRDLIPLEEQGKVEGFFNNVENVNRLGGLVEDIRDAMMEYQTSLRQDIDDKSCRLMGSTDLALLNGMYHTADASYRCGNRQGCLRGTREDVFREIERWSIGGQDQRIFLLNGLAGTGKSTIAQTFAETSFADGRLGASFFCSRDFEDRSNLRAIFPTLAFQLAHRYPLFRRKLLRVLRASPDVGGESLCSQMEKLIVGPLKANGIPTLVIIDALDECKDEEPASAIVSVLSRYVDEIPSVKFFITGRPEPRIRSGPRLRLLLPIAEVLKFYDVNPIAVNNDIRLFFRTRLANLAKNRSDCDLTKDWPSASDIEILCKKAAGFFIYASTVVKFLASEKDPPTERLALITSLPQNPVEERKSGVDQLYAKILEQAFGNVDQDLSSHLRSVLGAVLLTFRPLSVKALSDLLGDHSTPPRIRSAPRALHSLLLIPNNMGDPVRIFHKSFPDFLTDPGRCEDERFSVDRSVHHTDLLLSCLDLMNDRLKKNICDLDDNAFLSQVKDLPARRATYLGDALEYACQFWTNHLARVDSSCPGAEKVHKAIDDFFTTRLLVWIEVLSLMGNLNVGICALNDVERWYMEARAPCEWTSDTKRFISENFETIRDSPSQVYHSALPFSPSSSWLRKWYGAELSREVKVVTGLLAKWGPCSRTVSFDCTPLTLAYWNETIAVGLESNIFILSSITGSRTSILSGHTDTVSSLAFSSDGNSLVSGGYDKTVKLWDTQTGGLISTLLGHSSSVSSVSISSDLAVIASGSWDGIVRLWDARTGLCFHAAQVHNRRVTAVSFSPAHPRNFISASEDGTMKRWDTDGRQFGPAYDGYQVSFSSEGARFVSCRREVVTIWDSDTGTIVAEARMAGARFLCCCFSPDGRLVAGAAGRTVYVWDITSTDPRLVDTFIGHTDKIISLAFSSSLISASEDGSVKFWQIGASSADPVATDRKSTSSASIEFVGLEAKDSLAISSDSAGVVKTWDISTGVCKAEVRTPLGHSRQRDTRLIDNRLVSVWCANSGIRIWDIERGELQTVEAPEHDVKGLRISGDGSKVFCLARQTVRAWSLWTGEDVGKVEVGGWLWPDSLTVDGSRVWVHFDDLPSQGWDFGTQGSPPISLSNMTPNGNRLNFRHFDGGFPSRPSRVEDTVTGKEVFRLHGKYASPARVQWDGRYLVAGYNAGEVLILDFIHMIPQ